MNNKYKNMKKESGGVVYVSHRESFCYGHRMHSKYFSKEDNKKIFGKCNEINGHGHNCILEVTLRGNVNNKSGMITKDVKELKKAIKDVIVNEWDHKNLNLDTSIFRDLNPTVENMVVAIWNLLQKRIKDGRLYEVKLHETDKISAYYRGK